MRGITAILGDAKIASRVDAAWDRLSEDYDKAYASMPVKFMQRTELSFHDHVKLLGYLCTELGALEGDVVEIGVWKGKSLALMHRLVQSPTAVIGIDPCELPGQAQELGYFHETLFPDGYIVRNYSQGAIEQVLELSGAFKLLHIDGGHRSFNVWLDFLVYERFVVPGGCIVFDDYTDATYSPEVGPTVDKMHSLGIFDDYHVVGSVPGFENSYLLVKK
jgi:hypothetical protein